MHADLHNVVRLQDESYVGPLQQPSQCKHDISAALAAAGSMTCSYVVLCALAEGCRGGCLGRKRQAGLGRTSDLAGCSGLPRSRPRQTTAQKKNLLTIVSSAIGPGRGRATQQPRSRQRVQVSDSSTEANKRTIRRRARSALVVGVGGDQRPPRRRDAGTADRPIRSAVRRH